MQIVYIYPHYAKKAGTERMLIDKMNWLTSQGHHVVALSYEQGNHPFAFSLSPSVECVDLNVRFFPLYQMSIIKRLFMLFIKRKVLRKALETFLYEHKPDLIICTTYTPFVIRMLGRLCPSMNIPFVIESHVSCFSNSMTYKFRHRPIIHFFTTLFDNWTLGNVSRANLLIALTKGDASEWQRYIDRILVIPNPLPFYPKNVTLHDVCRHRILCVGRLHEQKGFDMLIDAFAMVAHQCPEWHIDIIGEGSEKTMLEEKISRCQLKNRISLCPLTDSISDEYMQSDFFVLSSRYEGFALVLLEAMSCGIPCVAFNCKYGPEDVIEDGVDGLLVEDGNIKALSEKMLWMITHKKERKEMGIRARQSVARYKKENVMKEWESAYLSVLDSK